MSNALKIPNSEFSERKVYTAPPCLKKTVPFRKSQGHKFSKNQDRKKEREKRELYSAEIISANSKTDPSVLGLKSTNNSSPNLTKTAVITPPPP